MKIVTYDQVDPLDVLNLNLLSLGYALTSKKATLIRRLDARPFPFFAIYAIKDRIVAGQVGVFRLPMLSADGPEDVGGIWAMCTHPAFSRQGIATFLLDEAHQRMRAAGLRFSTLGTTRHLGAHALYRKQGYQDVFSPASVFAARDHVAHRSHLRAEYADKGKLHLADSLFQDLSVGKLGFTRRQQSFITMMAATGEIGRDDVWLLWEGSELVGYALANVTESVLSVNGLLLAEGVDAARAIAALALEEEFSYIRVRIDHPSIARDLEQAGYPRALPGWGTFMIKPLASDIDIEDARQRFGIGTERFMISQIDIT